MPPVMDVLSSAPMAATVFVSDNTCQDLDAGTPRVNPDTIWHFLVFSVGIYDCSVCWERCKLTIKTFVHVDVMTRTDNRESS